MYCKCVCIFSHSLNALSMRLSLISLPSSIAFLTSIISGPLIDSSISCVVWSGSRHERMSRRILFIAGKDLSTVAVRISNRSIFMVTCDVVGKIVIFAMAVATSPLAACDDRSCGRCLNIFHSFAFQTYQHGTAWLHV